MTTNTPSPAHAAGPWLSEYSPFTTNDGREIPCFCIYDADGNRIASTEEDGDADVQEANAFLIAAAPDLLKMVRSARVAFLERILGVEEEKKELLDPDDFADQDIIDNYQWLIDRCDEVLASAEAKPE